MTYKLIEIYRDNLPNAWGVYRLPAGRRAAFGLRPLAIFETEGEARAWIASN